MPRFLHLSDLHFGTKHVTHLSDLILVEIARWKPEAVVVSGDFTLRGRHSEYQEARAFIAKIKSPLLAVPGNHDQPFFAPIERLLSPMRRYRRYIHATPDATLNVPGLTIVGLNDNRPIAPGGFWSSTQRAWLAAELARAPRDSVKVVVSHHHFLWGGKWRPAGFWGPSGTLKWLRSQGVRLVLNGHTHVPTAAETPEGVVVVRAGTATCSRTRQGWGNTYNVIQVDSEQIVVSILKYSETEDAFVQVQQSSFSRSK